MNSKLRIAAYGGILSLFLTPPEIYLEHLLNESPGTEWIFLLIILIYLASVLSTTVLYYGFYLIGNTYRVPSIMVSSIVIIILKIIWYTFQVFAIQEPIAFYNLFGGTILVIFGISRIAFGYGIFQIGSELGKPAKSMAILEVLIGLFLVTVIAYLGGLVLSIIVAFMQIVILLKLSKTFENIH